MGPELNLNQRALLSLLLRFLPLFDLLRDHEALDEGDQIFERVDTRVDIVWELAH